MCPDKQLLSVYYDGELPSPWKEKMDAHLAACSGCRMVTSVYGRLSSLLKVPVSEGVPSDAASARMRETLRTVQSRAVPSRVRRVFARRVAVPLPLAVAAAAALVFAFSALLAQSRNVQRIPEASAVAESINLEPEEIRQVTSMDDALRFIDNNEFFAGPQSSYVIMRLPENKTFYNYGNPEIQNVAGNPLRGGNRR
jgi:anti-sigma factor RsiW